MAYPEGHVLILLDWPEVHDMSAILTNFLKSFSPKDVVKASATLTSFPFDIATIMETQRRNLQALATMQQLTLESFQVIAQRQSAILADLAAAQAHLTQEWNESDSPEDKIGDQALRMKDLYERLIAHLQEINVMMTQSRTETADVLHARVGATLAEVKDAVDRAKAKRAA